MDWDSQHRGCLSQPGDPMKTFLPTMFRTEGTVQNTDRPRPRETIGITPVRRLSSHNSSAWEVIRSQPA
jgi:hypothetical protein